MYYVLYYHWNGWKCLVSTYPLLWQHFRDCDGIITFLQEWILVVCQEKYPFPIMPVHFLDRGPKDLGVWWRRYCPNDVCSLQTMRWGHAHPTWTYWALPFIGRWLRRNFRDETLPKVTVGTVKAPALRVVEIPEDEDLLNVGLWEEKAHKQWCKFDITDPLEFTFLFEWKTKYGNKCSMGGHGCANISPDRRFYKHGAAKLFYTAHHAIEPSQTHNHVDRISKKVKEGTWPKSTIVFQQKLWTAEDLRKDHPQLECLVWEVRLSWKSDGQKDGTSGDAQCATCKLPFVLTIDMYLDEVLWFWMHKYVCL